MTFDKCKCQEHFKIAELIPIYKSGNKLGATNYRPVLLYLLFLSFLAKFFEEALKQRLMNFIRRYSIINGSEYIFQENKSTTDVLAYFTKLIYTILEKSRPMSVVLLNLAKAFDTVKHDLFPTRLANIGFRSPVNQIVSSYLTNGKQFAKLSS